MRRHVVRGRPPARREEELAWRIAEVAADPVAIEDDVAAMVASGVDDVAVAVAGILRAPVVHARDLVPRRLRKAVERAEILRLLDTGALRGRMEHLPGRRTRVLETLLAELATHEPDLTRSELEERFSPSASSSACLGPRATSTSSAWGATAARSVASTAGASPARAASASLFRVGHRALHRPHERHPPA